MNPESEEFGQRPINNGDLLEVQKMRNDRDESGKFVKGHPGGPGRPPGSRNLSTVFMSLLTEEDMARVTRALIAEAVEGNVQAIALLFKYVLGEPTQNVDITSGGLTLVDLINEINSDVEPGSDEV